MKSYWNFKSSKFLLLWCLFCTHYVSAQFSNSESDLGTGGEERYLYPIYPGKPGSLAGTMGELRSTHFHSGIDIRTNNMTGYPVVASKSGYVSRATISPFGYGNILYITHPDGNTTLYAHLDKFEGAVGAHVLAEQYRQQKNQIDLTFEPGQFPVKQGEVIALSGNTGSSSGPHLHFDIRDKNNFALDPLKVGQFSEVSEKLPPYPEVIALRSLEKDARINDRFGRFEFHAATRAADRYVIASPILASGWIGVEIIAKDRLASRSPFFGGVNSIRMSVDSQLVFDQNIEKVNIAETRSIYTLMNYRTLRTSGDRFYKLYIDDGNTLEFYSDSPGNGRIRVTGSKIIPVDIELLDSYGNSSVVSFKLKPSPPVREIKTLETLNAPLQYELHDNVLQVHARPCTSEPGPAQIYYGNTSILVMPDYYNYNRSVYLIDLRSRLPDSVTVCSETLRTRFRHIIPSGIEYKYYGDWVDLRFEPATLFDTLYLRTGYWVQPQGNEMFSIGDRTHPLQSNLKVSLRPFKAYSPADKWAVYRVIGRGYSYLGGTWENGRVNFSTREFGDFTILKDATPPSIQVVFADRSGVRCKVRDDLSGIDSVNATVNGEWLLMHYDNKTATIWSERLHKNKPLSGNFVLTVIDRAGNVKTYQRKL